jgi:hypothetical protein
VSNASTELTIATANVTSIVGQKLHIDATGNGPVQLDDSSSGTTTGFDFYGEVVFWVSSSGAWESSFFAKPEGTSDSWQIVWDANPSTGDNVLPVALKKTPPGNHSTDGITQ